MKRILTNNCGNNNILRDLLKSSGIKKGLVTLSRRQKILLLRNKLKHYSKPSIRVLKKKHYQTRKLEIFKQQILQNTQNYNISLDKDKLFNGGEFDISLKKFKKDNTFKFYQIQIITPKNYKQYIVLTSRGIVGKQPEFDVSKFSNFNSAFQLFKQKYSRKTKDGYQRSDYTFLKQCNSRIPKKLVKTYLISQLV